MAIKIKLEKDGFIKDGFVGYSYTSVFFNVWLPAFRLDFNGFVIFFGTLMFIQFLPAFLFIYIILNPYEIQNSQTFLFIRVALWGIPFILGAWYNQYYTKKLLKEGWRPLENDEYSSAILKAYHYLDYMDTELINDEKIQRYNNFLLTTRTREKKKAFAFSGYIIIIIIFLYFLFKN